MTDESDEHLVLRVRDLDDTRAFGQLVKRHQASTHALVLAIIHDWAEAQDIVQESFLRAYLNINQLKEPAKFSSWLHRLACRISIDVLRTRRIRLISSYSDDDFDAWTTDNATTGEDNSSPLERLLSQERSDRVLRAISGLPERYRIPLVMFYFDGCDYQEVAQFLGAPLGTIKSLISRARVMLEPALRVLVMESPIMAEDATNQTRLPIDFTNRLMTLIDAVKADDVASVAHLLHLNPTLARGTTPTCETALHIAAMHGRMQIVKLLLDHGADPEASGVVFGQTAMNLAGWYGHVDLVKMLLKAGADPSAAAHYAWFGQPSRHQPVIDVVRRHLAEQGVGFNADSRYDRTTADLAIGAMEDKTLPPASFLLSSSKKAVGIDEIQSEQNRFLSAVDDLRKNERIIRRGPNIFIYDTVDVQANRFVFDNGFAVPDETVVPAGEVFVKRLPTFRCASVLFQGRYTDIGEGWTSLFTQMKKAGFQPSNETREVYHYLEAPDSTTNLTELQAGIAN